MSHTGTPKRNRRRAPVSICRKPRPEPGVREMELIGCLPDGTLFVWQEKGLVRPIDRFPMHGDRIAAGHYIVEHRGCAVVVHLSTVLVGMVTVQQMGGHRTKACLPHGTAEEMLLGQVLNDPEEEASIMRAFAALKGDRERAARTPHRLRGRAGS